jgi:GYF domain 2
MLVATFGPATGWSGKTITREGDVFTLQDHGPITAGDVMEYDRQAPLVWANDGTRAWVGSLALTEKSQRASGVMPSQAAALTRSDTLPDASTHMEQAVEGWYYVSNGTRAGPLDGARMRQLLAAGTMTNATQVWKPGFGGWMPAGETALRQTPTEPPPVPGSAVNNGLVWTVAFVPLAGSILGLMLGLVGWPLAILFLAVNITLCFIDSGVLGKAGYDTSAFGGWAFLIPVYLYRRAKALDQSLAYFATWMVCFFLSLFI